MSFLFSYFHTLIMLFPASRRSNLKNGKIEEVLEEGDGP